MRYYGFLIWGMLFVFACRLGSGDPRLNGIKANQRMVQIKKAEMSFRSMNNNERYGNLSELCNAGLLDQVLADGDEGGYKFELIAGVGNYEVLAIPKNKSDQHQFVGHAFYLDQAGVIRGRAYGKADLYRPPTKTDLPVNMQE